MKVRCHCCNKLAADIRDASMAKGTVLVCAFCAVEHFPKREKRGGMTDSMPDFMADFFKGFK